MQGWGAVGGGAWGGSNNQTFEEEDRPAPAPQQQDAGAYGAYGSTPPTLPPSQPAPELATTSYRSQSGTAANNGFGGAGGAYGSSTFGRPVQPSAPAAGSSLTEAQLARKEAELAAKEKQLKELEAKLAKDQPKKNWPICYPITYHSIGEEIPPGGSRRVVWEGYMAWWGLFVCLWWNWFCTCVMLGYRVNNKVPSWFLGLVYLICGIPLSWWLWYKRLYNGAKADSTLGFLGFFLWFALHCAFCIWAAIAVPFSANSWSFAGFVTAMNALDVNNFTGVIYLVGAALWSTEAAFSCWVITDVFLFWRGKGGVKEAKETAAKEAALAAFRQQTASRV